VGGGDGLLQRDSSRWASGLLTSSGSKLMAQAASGSMSGMCVDRWMRVVAVCAISIGFRSAAVGEWIWAIRSERRPVAESSERREGTRRDAIGGATFRGKKNDEHNKNNNNQLSIMLTRVWMRGLGMMRDGCADRTALGEWRRCAAAGQRIQLSLRQLRNLAP